MTSKKEWSFRGFSNLPFMIDVKYIPRKYSIGINPLKRIFPYVCRHIILKFASLYVSDLNYYFSLSTISDWNYLKKNQYIFNFLSKSDTRFI